MERPENYFRPGEEESEANPSIEGANEVRKIVGYRQIQRKKSRFLPLKASEIFRGRFAEIRAAFAAGEFRHMSPKRTEHEFANYSEKVRYSPSQITPDAERELITFAIANGFIETEHVDPAHHSLQSDDRYRRKEKELCKALASNLRSLVEKMAEGE